MLKYNILIEGIIKEFTVIKPKHVSFILNDSEGNQYQCFSNNIKKKLSVTDEILIIGAVSSGNKINIAYVINKSKNSEENLFKLKAGWRLYVSLFLIIIFAGIFIFLLLSFSNLIPIELIALFPPLEVVEEIYTLINNLSPLILLIALVGITGINLYSLFRNRRISNEIEKEKNRLKMAGIRPKIITPISKKEKMQETVIETEEPPEEMACPDCGERLPLDAMFCSKCGKTI